MTADSASAGILHVDMDAFYASVEERDNPSLRGCPVMVGGTPAGRGVVAAANYAARRFGVYSATPAVTARRLCPQGVFLPLRMDHYAAVSRQIRAIFMRYTPVIQPLALDEAFLDVRASRRLFGDGRAIGERIQRDIADELGLVASVGVAPNKFLAKIASDLDKPRGFVVVEPGQVDAFLAPLPVRRLWGVGKVAGRTLDKLGIRTIGQLRGLPEHLLREHFGQTGSHLWRLARGIDERPVVVDRRAKSLSHETTFREDISDLDQLKACLMALVEQLAMRLRENQLKACSVQIKVRFSDFDTITRSAGLERATDITRELWSAAVGLLDGCGLGAGRPVRLLGMGVSGLEQPGGVQQPDLFAEPGREQQQRLDEVADRIADRFGRGSLRRGAGLSRN